LPVLRCGRKVCAALRTWRQTVWLPGQQGAAGAAAHNMAGRALLCVGGSVEDSWSCYVAGAGAHEERCACTVVGKAAIQRVDVCICWVGGALLTALHSLLAS
jgi:hypothetical protein